MGCAAAVSLVVAQTPAQNPAPNQAPNSTVALPDAPVAKPYAAAKPAVAAKSVIPPPGPLPTGTLDMVSSMPPAVNPANLYSEIASNKLSPNVAGALERVYVPNRGENTVSVIDPATLKVIDKFNVGIHPQHIVPSWDLKTLWV